MLGRPVALALVSAIFLAVALWRSFRVMKPVFQASGAARLDRPLDRLKGLWTDVALHRRLRRKRYAGTLHALMFSGFIILFTVTIESFVGGFFPHFSFAPFGEATWLGLLQDIFAALVFVALGMAIYQRAVIKPARFKSSNQKDAWTIYGLIGAVVGGLLCEAIFHQVATSAPSPWRPITGSIAKLLQTSGMSPGAALQAQAVAYWVHVVAVLSFLAYIPGSKHRHMFTAIPNIYFRALDKKDELPAIDLEAGPIGVSKIEQLDWKHKLDLVSCTECGRCEEVCPANAAGLPLSPKKIVMDMRDHMFAGGTCEGGLQLVDGVISDETLFACTTCRACMDACPVRIEPMTKLIEMRRAAIEEGEVEPMLQDALANLQRTGNSQGKPAKQRAKWTQGLPFKLKDARKEPVDVLWFVGDHASFDPRVQEITRKVALLLDAAGVDFGILYEGEQNSGNDVRRVGEEGAFETLATANIATLAQCSFQRIVTTDPHTLNALRTDYANLGAHYTVLHYTQLLVELIDADKLRLRQAGGKVVTYHDPCYLGRYSGEFDAPRELIRRAGYTLQDMDRSRENSFCCGAGGGRIWMDDSAMTERPSENRIKEALALDGVSGFIVSCPKDTIMYRAAVQALGVEDRIMVQDIADLLVIEEAVAPQEEQTAAAAA
ncbi:heterodisulfide reductase-related iron-sulfur binding cluster [Sphingomonas abietis]|uniref:Heterodisulfide reductase-related iron-sulfur binding cluster n=1 Tax=Sphingomonas abietis TaxID=3012344 RepID=A0ABY7NKB7_9SPHN|nr:heterodisulfide reductase-related iron-sulfur binding cluster [Sphingomonas abietis]WBO21971.1 heterodisulfide reductase-related iron-sulfur binding cluster [Sphingomonas abietis]